MAADSTNPPVAAVGLAKDVASPSLNQDPTPAEANSISQSQLTPSGQAGSQSQSQQQQSLPTPQQQQQQKPKGQRDKRRNRKPPTGAPNAQPYDGKQESTPSPALVNGSSS